MKGRGELFGRVRGPVIFVLRIVVLALFLAGCSTRPGLDDLPPPPPPPPKYDLEACMKCDGTVTSSTTRCVDLRTACSSVAVTIEEITACKVGFNGCCADIYDGLERCELARCPKPEPERWSCTADCWRASADCDAQVGADLIACSRAPGCDATCYNLCVARANNAVRACEDEHNDNCLPSCDSPR